MPYPPRLLIPIPHTHHTHMHSVSLAKGASPPLMAQGAALAALFLERGLASGDHAVLGRLLGLLLTPLLSPTEDASSYAEWVVARCLVALLEANAHCGVLAASSGDEDSAKAIAAAHAPHAECVCVGVLGWRSSAVQMRFCVA